MNDHNIQKQPSWRQLYKQKSSEKYQNLRKREISQRKMKHNKEKSIRSIEKSLLTKLYDYSQKYLSKETYITKLFEDAKQQAMEQDVCLSFVNPNNSWKSQQQACTLPICSTNYVNSEYEYVHKNPVVIKPESQSMNEIQNVDTSAFIVSESKSDEEMIAYEQSDNPRNKSFHCCCCLHLKCGQCNCMNMPVALHCSCCKYINI